GWRIPQGAADCTRHAAGPAARCRAAAPDSGPATPADRHGTLAARAPCAGASRSISRRADVVGDSRPGAGGDRTLARLHGSGRHLRRRARRCRTGTAAAPQTTTAAFVSISDALTALLFELAHELDKRLDAFFGESVVDRRAHTADG